jgi:hypothetical protein
MSAMTRTIYESSNGDRWLLVRGSAGGGVSVLHVANAASGGQKTDFELDAFLLRQQGSPQCQALLRLIGTLVEEGAPDA